MAVLKVYLEEQPLIKYYLINYLILLKTQNMIDECQKGLASMVFDEKTAGCAVKNEIMQNNGLAEKLLKPIIRKFAKRKVRSVFRNNIWSIDLADMQLLRKFNRGIRFSCVTDICKKICLVYSFER